MMKLSAFLILLTIAVQLNAQSPIMQPTISPDGSNLAFSYQGDIWLSDTDGKNLSRLTIHEAYEGDPIWSTDGKEIIFASDRYGNQDLFSIPLTGGSPKRLSFHSASDVPYSVTAKGDIIFTSSRNYKQVERESEIYILKAGAKTENRFMDALGLEPVSSPDGIKIAFVRGTCRIEREAYQGPANRDIWVYDRNTEKYEQITTDPHNDFAPQWLSNNELLFISGRNGRYNIHQKALDGDFKQITSEKSFGIIYFSLSKTAKEIAYQTAEKSFLFDLESNSKLKLEIQISSDYRFDPVVKESVSNNVDEFAISPNGKFIAFINRGELFVSRNDKEDDKSIRLTDGPAREREITWLNDEVLLFISDREGQNDLYRIKSTDAQVKDLFYSFKREITRLTNTKEEENNPIVSPDGKKIALTQGGGKLQVFDVDSLGKLTNEKILLDGWDEPSGLSWSPDSKWLAYSKSDLDFNSEIFIQAVEKKGAAINVSMHPKRDYNPIWSKDGSKLGFVSERNNGDSDIWFAWLKREDWEKSSAEWNRYNKEIKDKDTENKKKEDESKDEEKSVDPTVIDIQDIYKRLDQVTRFTGGESDFAFDDKGEFIYYINSGVSRKNYEIKRDLYKIKWDGSEKSMIDGTLEPYALQKYPQKGKFYFMMKGGMISAIDTKSDKIEKLSVTAEMKIHYKEELEQIFEEGWRILGARFYDPQFHGQDWNALKENYKPIALSASTKQDFQTFYNFMLGQLNASHMGLYGSNAQKETQRERTGLIGVEGEMQKEGFKVSRIVQNSPADRKESKLLVGDIITTINQHSVSPNENFFAMLEGTVNERTLLTVKRGKSVEEILIWPSSSLRSELYDEWVEDRRKLVDEYSNGKLGYLHIQGMNWTSFERFERELMAAGYEKEGIVIDVRYNGGGWTTDYLMAVLNVDQHAYTIPRGAAKTLKEHKDFKEHYPFGERLPLASWTKPSIALCNQNSYSNAEIFSHAYKTLDLGTLVGTPTFGAVISTGGARLQDGSLIRVPFRAWYVKATEENMENGPAVPDILVQNPPAYKAKNVDPQLKKSVEVLLGQIN